MSSVRPVVSLDLWDDLILNVKFKYERYLSDEKIIGSTSDHLSIYVYFHSSGASLGYITKFTIDLYGAQNES